MQRPIVSHPLSVGAAVLFDGGCLLHSSDLSAGGSGERSGEAENPGAEPSSGVQV